jgi:hypothetical protein
MDFLLIPQYTKRRRKNMKLHLRIATITLTLFLLCPLLANAAPAGRKFGLGFVLGDPTAITGKYFLTQEEALDFGLAFNFNNYILAYGDYLFHWPGGFDRSSLFLSQLNPYVGIGGLLVFFDRTYYGAGKKYSYYDESASVGFGARVPLGIEWNPSKPPLGVFIEIVPGIMLIPRTSGFFQAGIGVRYYF